MVANTYLKEEDYLNNIEEQKKMNVFTLIELKKRGATESVRAEIDFYFYSNSENKLTLLADELENMGFKLYEVEETDEEGEFSLLGTVPEIALNIESLNRWTTNMCNLGYKYDCDFSGWETET